MKEMLNINNKKYYLDIDEIFKYCAISRQTSDYRQKEISDSYERDEESDSLMLQQKVVHEVISPNDMEIDENKLDVLKMVISIVLTSEKGDMTNDTPYSQKLAFNTLLNKDFIKEEV